MEKLIKDLEPQIIWKNLGGSMESMMQQERMPATLCMFIYQMMFSSPGIVMNMTSTSIIPSLTLNGMVRFVRPWTKY